MKVSIIGTGPGTKDYLLPIAKREIEKADCLIGAKRLIALFRNLGKEDVLIAGHFDAAIDYIKKHRRKKKIAVLVSGDPGMYSFLESISKTLKKEEYVVIPGISTLQLAFAKIGESWHDAKVISLHGRKLNNLTQVVEGSRKLFLFTDRSFPAHKIAAQLLKDGLENRRAVVLENLSYLDERIVDTDLKHLSRMKKFGLCAMIIEKFPPAKGKLYGIGIGPGDPKTVTLKAKEILERVDTIFVPKGNEDSASCSRAIVETLLSRPKPFVELTFPMTKDKNTLNKYWGRAAEIIAKEIKKGKEVAFVTIGDPFIYSTYIYLLKGLRKDFPGIHFQTLPGISAFNAAASIAGIPLVEGDEKLAILPVTKDLKGVRETLQEFDSVVLMKVGSKLDRVVRLLKELGLARYATLISHAGQENERIIRNLTSLRDKKVGYLSVIIVKKGLKV